MLTEGFSAISAGPNGTASLYGVHLSGLVAWALWRGIYLSKMPGDGQARPYRPGLAVGCAGRARVGRAAPDPFDVRVNRSARLYGPPRRLPPLAARRVHRHAQDKTRAEVGERLEALVRDGRRAAPRGHRTCGHVVRRGDTRPDLSIENPAL